MKFGQLTIPEEHIFLKTDLSFAFVNLRPFLPFHILLSPINIKIRLEDLSLEEYRDIFSTIKLIIERLKHLGTSWTITLQNGEEAGQTIPHLHFHIIPRKKGDLENNNDIYKGVQIDVKRVPKTFEEMKSECEYLKKFFNEKL